MKNIELTIIKKVLAAYGGEVARHDPSGKEQKLEVRLPDDARTYRYHFANHRRDPDRVMRRDLLRALNRERAKREKPPL